VVLLLLQKVIHLLFLGVVSFLLVVELDRHLSEIGLVDVLPSVCLFLIIEMELRDLRSLLGDLYLLDASQLFCTGNSTLQHFNVLSQALVDLTLPVVLCVHGCDLLIVNTDLL